MPPINRYLQPLRRAYISQGSSIRLTRPAFAFHTQSIRYQQTAAQPSAEEGAPPSRDTAPNPKKIKTTAESYPSLQRESRFKKLDEKDVKFFRDLLGSESAVIDGVTQENSEELEGYNSDWMRKYRGQARLVLRPESTKQVSEILKYCNDNLIAVNPQGGNTGLVGGSVPVFDEVVLSLGRMNKIRDFRRCIGHIRV